MKDAATTLKGKRPTIRDVASAAAVSPAVVSIVLNGREDSTIRVRPQTRQRVEDAALKLGYTPALQARGLRQQRSYVLGVLLSEANSWLAADVIRGIQEIASPRRYSPIVFIHSGSDQEREEFERSLDRRVDALLVDTYDLPAHEENIQRYVERAGSGFPLIELFGISIPGVPKVNFDFYGDARRAVEHLIERGHRQIAVVLPETFRQSVRHWTVWQFYQGCHDALQTAAMDCQLIEVPAVSAAQLVDVYRQGGANAARQILDGQQRPTAVLCFGVLRAHGLLEELAGEVSVPDDISVFAGGYDIQYAPLARPALTGMALDAQAAGRAAASRVFELLDGQAAQDTLIPCLMHEGASVAPCRSGSNGHHERTPDP